MDPHDLSSDLNVFLIVLLNVWPLFIRGDKVSKSSLRLASSDICSIIDDLQRCVRAQLRATVRGCHLSAFRRIEHLHIYGTLTPQPHQLGRVLQGLSSRLADVTRLDLHYVRCLSGDCVAAVAGCMPRLADINLLDNRMDGLSDDLTTSGHAPPPSPPDTHFYDALSALPPDQPARRPPPLQAHVDALGRLTRLTRLQLRGNWKSHHDLRPLGQLVHLRSLQLPFDLGTRGPQAALPDMAWVSSLVNLEELHHCLPPGLEGMRALQSCLQLTSLTMLDLCTRVWEDTAPPALCLPALQELRCGLEVPPNQLVGLLRGVSLPSLQRLTLTVSLTSSSWFENDTDEGARELEEAVRLLPARQWRFRMLLRECRSGGPCPSP